MALTEHPRWGSLVLCDYSKGFVAPEMIKRRLSVVISKKISARPGLCTVVPLSTTHPNPVMPYHLDITLTKELPERWAQKAWVKADMICAVSLQRLDFIRKEERLPNGKRSYCYEVLPVETMKDIQACVLHGLGLGYLEQHL